jgi:hypothetical protein
MEIFRVHRAPERALRRRARGVCAEAAAAVLVFEEREVRRDLAREVCLGPPRANRIEESQYKASRLHGSFRGV